MANHVNGLDEIDMEYTLDAWGDVPPLTGHTLFAESATEKQRADLANMTLATLCDMVLGEDAADRSDDALVRAVGELERERDAAQGALEFAQRYWMDAIAERDAANERAEQAEAESNEWENVAIAISKSLRMVPTLAHGEMRPSEFLVCATLAANTLWLESKRIEQLDADARVLAQRVFETEILTDSEIEIVARYVPREQMEGAGYK